MSRKRREGWLQRCPLSYDQARCIHPPFAECYAIQAFSIASDFDPKQMPKVQNQITMRKVCIVIQSLVSLSSTRQSAPQVKWVSCTAATSTPRVFSSPSKRVHLPGSLNPLTFKVARFRVINPTYLTPWRLWAGNPSGWGCRRPDAGNRCRAQYSLGRPC